jgi:hypothetical protein
METEVRMADDTIPEMTLRWNDPLAVEVTAQYGEARPTGSNV